MSGRRWVTAIVAVVAVVAGYAIASARPSAPPEVITACDGLQSVVMPLVNWRQEGGPRPAGTFVSTPDALPGDSPLRDLHERYEELVQRHEDTIARRLVVRPENDPMGAFDGVFGDGERLCGEAGYRVHLLPRD